MFQTIEKINLNEEQKQALTDILNYRNNGHSQVRLVGSAGSGKTFLLNELLKQVTDKSVSIICPTHKAAKVAKRVINKDVEDNLLGFKYEPLTLAKALGQVPMIEVEEGKQVFVNRGAVALGDFIVVDEGSMVSSDNLKELQKTAPENSFILYILDPIQLPPINEKGIPIYELDIPEINLTTTQRFFSGSPIGQITTAIRTKDERLMNVNWNGFATFCLNNNIKVYTNEDKFLTDFVEEMKSSNWNNNPDSVRALSYTNKVINKFNLYAKQKYFGEGEQYDVGEVLIAKTPFQRITPNIYSEPEELNLASSSSKQIIVQNGEEVKLLNKLDEQIFIYAGYEKKPIKYEVWEAQVEEDRTINCNLIDPQSIKNYNHIVNKLSTRALEIPLEVKNKKGKIVCNRKERSKAWSAMYKFRESFDIVSRSYAMTVHSAQGSTFETVYFDFSLLTCSPSLPIRRSLVYTGLTRPSSNLRILMPSRVLDMIKTIPLTITE
jgi:exodeoxyribonuclease V